MRLSRSRPDFVQCVTRSYIYDAPFTVYARLCSVCYKELYLWCAFHGQGQTLFSVFQGAIFMMRLSRSRPDFVQCVTRSYIYDAPFTVKARLCSVCYKELYLWCAFHGLGQTLFSVLQGAIISARCNLWYEFVSLATVNRDHWLCWGCEGKTSRKICNSYGNVYFSIFSSLSSTSIMYLSLHAVRSAAILLLSCAGSSWLPLPLISFPSFSLLPTPNRPCQSERSSKARHEADSFEPAEWSERLTPGQSGWQGAAAVGSILALALSLFLTARQSVVGDSSHCWLSITFQQFRAQSGVVALPTKGSESFGVNYLRTRDAICFLVTLNFTQSILQTSTQTHTQHCQDTQRGYVLTRFKRVLTLQTFYFFFCLLSWQHVHSFSPNLLFYTFFFSEPCTKSAIVCYIVKFSLSGSADWSVLYDLKQ